MAGILDLLASAPLRGMDPLNDYRKTLLAMQQATTGVGHPALGQTDRPWLDKLATSTMMIPGVGDITGLAADAARYATDSEQRTPLNFGLSALGALPFVPAMTTLRGKASSQSLPPGASDAYDVGREIAKKHPVQSPEEMTEGYWRRVIHDPDLGMEIPDFVFQTDYDPFLVAGILGDVAPQRVRGWRLGAIPESGVSFNVRDGFPERGVSVWEVDGGGRAQDAVSGMFIAAEGRPRVDVEGFLHPYATGSDGEPLLVFAREVPSGNFDGAVKKARAGGKSFHDQVRK